MRAISLRPKAAIRGNPLINKATIGLVVLILGSSPQVLQAAENEAATPVVELAPFVLSENRVANDTPAGGFATPATALQFEPRLDLQTRNFGEAQGDVSIRGGIFEGTAVQVSGLTVFDPQTGHYAAELPIAPTMLEAPQVSTGLDHAFAALNATAGTVQYRWRPVQTGGTLSAAIGNGSLRRAGLRAGHVFERTGFVERRVRWAGEADFAFSEADGTIANGDHEFFRASGRIEATSEFARTQIFAGYQSKFFGWPNLYTPFGFAETENLQTTLYIVSHRIERDDFTFETAAHWRRNKDDYEINRFSPGAFNPFQHETRVTGAFAQAGIRSGEWQFDLRGELAADEIESTALTAGRFNSRSYWRLAGLATRRWGAPGEAQWETRLGAAFDDTNREGSAVSPLAEVSWNGPARGDQPQVRWYAQLSESTRVPGYTALNSAAGSGLFRGNPDLAREDARNLETGVQLRSANWSLHAAVFHRRDDPLVDWTFTAGSPNARSASPVQLDTTGVEIVGRRTFGPIDLIAGYTWLEKDADYLGATVDASFYALNFPRHRLTVAVIARLGGGFELRSDNEFRAQQENLLRTIGGDDAVLSSLGLYWRPPQCAGLELSLLADNLWQSDFQELPAVPAPGRQVTFGAAWSW